MSTLAIATAREVFDLLRDDLVAIEQELGRDAASGVSTITEIAEYLREGGGKRIRPSLLLLSAHMLGYSGQGSIRLGAVVEMVHTATLVHDDIIDAADTRRGRPSANTQNLFFPPRLPPYSGGAAGVRLLLSQSQLLCESPGKPCLGN